MSYLVLARKYRPQTFNQVIKQNHIIQTLTNAIASDRVAHAILFSGPRGTGKTTVARILAKAMNCKEGPATMPCNVCRSCQEITSGNAVDVFEIDGASNNSVDQVRDLRGNIKYMPAHSLYKIYIIDEVHMLSLAAFNALLKTLEEPPSHVMFIFATTEPYKIPATILSRCQRHDFRRIDVEAISKHLRMVCHQENFDMADESLSLIAREAEGSIRDALSLLDQVMACADGSITHDQVLNMLGVIDRKTVGDIAEAVLHGSITKLFDIVDEVYDQGHDIKKLYSDLMEHFRNLLVVKIGQNSKKLVNLPAHEIDLMSDQVKEVSAAFLSQIFDIFFKEESAIRYSSQPKLAIEMMFVRMFQIKPALPIDLLIEKLDNLTKKIYENHENKISETQADYGDPEKKPLVEAPFDDGENLDSTWEKIVDSISESTPALAANLTKCTLKKISDLNLEIEINGNGYNINTINKNIAIIKKACHEFLGEKMNITIKTDPKKNNENQQKKRFNRLRQEALNHPRVKDAIEIFNAQVLDVKIL